MKVQSSLLLGLLTSACLLAPVVSQAGDEPTPEEMKAQKAQQAKRRAEIKALKAKSFEKYKVCDVKALSDTLAKDFSVRLIADAEAKYDYYMITNHLALNADAVRSATCKFIRENQCYVYWGNVVRMAMIAHQKAPWFPADTSPHYMLSPIITCDTIDKK